MIAPRQFKRPSVTRSTRSPGSASGICRTASTISLGVDAVPGGIGTTAVQRNRGPEIEASVARVVEQIFVSRGERVAKADHLKTIAVADEPDLHLAPARPVGRHLLEAREAGYLVVGSIDVLRPAAGSRKVSLPYCRRLEIRDLLRPGEIANVEHPQASIL